MSTIIKTIKDYLTDDTIYPITKASAVYMEGSTNTVEGLLANIGNTDISTIGNGTITGAINAITDKSINNQVNDANDAVQTNIIYSAGGNALNTPFSAYWTIWCYSYSNIHKTQYATIVNAIATRTYVRNLANDVWGNWRKIEDTNPVTITNGVVTSATPQVIQGNNMVTIEFAVILPARTYTQTDILWTVSKSPSGMVHFVCGVGTDYRLARINTSGGISFNSNLTLSSTAYMIGSLTYPFSQ